MSLPPERPPASERPSRLSQGPESQRPSLALRVTAPPPTLSEMVARTVVSFLTHFGQISQIFFGSLRALFKRPLEIREIIRQMEGLGVASMGIVVVTSLFIGMVMSTQFAFGLQKFGGMEYTGRVVGLSFARELAPTLTAVIVGGRIGAGMAAELGSMAVTEQLDAVRALGADPTKKLVMPRLVAAIIVMPVLAVFALVLGFSGAMFITDWQFNVQADFFLRSALQTVTMKDFAAGLFKTPVFGAIIALIGCHFGMHTTGGTAGVGTNTTRTVVAISIVILIADFFLTKLSIVLWAIA